jgi:hypothetical protein
MKMKLLILGLTILSLQLSAQTDKKITSSFCEILGMLNEYNSRFDYPSGMTHDTIVEIFYPDETDKLNHFKDLIKQYEKETSQTFLVNENVGPQGHYYLYSDSLSKLLNSYYKVDQKNLASLDKNIFQNLRYDLKYSYLRGAYYRFGSGDEIKIANGINKLKTIALVMEILNVSDIRLYKSTGNSTPTDYILTFGISDLVVKELIVSDVISTTNFNNYKEIPFY